MCDCLFPEALFSNLCDATWYNINVKIPVSSLEYE